jgi:TetR/AcrR family transcriptional regulator
VVKVGRERDAEVAREAILEAAKEVFAQEGFDGARIDTIADKAGYNKSLIFHYFGDKEGLYRTIITRLKGHILSEYMEPLTAFTQCSDEMSSSRVRIFLELAVERYFAFLTRYPCNLRIMAWEAAEGWHTFMGEPVKELKIYKSSMICLADFLRRAQEAGLINQKLDVRLLMMNIANMCIMHFLSLPRYKYFFDEAVTGRQESLAYVRQQIVELVLHGILISPVEGPER